MSTTEILDPTTNNWTPGPPLPTGYYSGCVVSLNEGESKHLMAGGSDAAATLPRTYTYDWDETTPIWRDAGTLSRQRKVLR